MNLVARVKTFTELETFHQLGVDVFSLDTIFTTKVIQVFNLDEIKRVMVYALEHQKRVYVLINRMIHQDDISNLVDFLSQLKPLQVSGIVINDLTVYVLAKKLGMEDLIIYQPGTMNTDSFSAIHLSNKQLKGITLSREITLEEIEEIARLKQSIELSIIGHGYLDMFYSKRKLITHYALHKNISGKEYINNVHMRLNEEIRPDDFYPILEDAFGTHMFRSHKLLSFHEMKRLHSILSDFFIERLFIEDAEYYDSIRLYKGHLPYSEFMKKYQGFDSGFYYRRTEKRKGDLDED